MTNVHEQGAVRSSQSPQGFDLGTSGDCTGLQDDIVLTDLAKEVLTSGKGRGSSQALGVLQRPLKKGLFENSSKVGRKKDLEKIKFTGDLLVESGSVKPIDVHFLQPPP